MEYMEPFTGTLQYMTFFQDFEEQIQIGYSSQFESCDEASLETPWNLREILDLVTSETAGVTEYLGKIQKPWHLEEQHWFQTSVFGIMNVNNYFDVETGEYKEIEVEVAGVAHFIIKILSHKQKFFSAEELQVEECTPAKLEKKFLMAADMPHMEKIEALKQILSFI